ncbi:MAG: HEXXH motif domain-containing protein [Actinomycetota bacterium]|nr:HEXXH motif domain-containing protein [Actinomycetota bacterium]
MKRVSAFKTHRLPDTAFTALAAGGGEPAVIRLLCETQQSKHTMLLHAIAEAVGDADLVDPGIAAFRAGYDLLTRIQAADPGACAWLLSLPHLGGWAHDGLIRLEQGMPPDFAYLACAAASGAVRAGVPFDLDVPVRDGCVLLPGLGRLDAGGGTAWIRLRYDGEQLAAGDGAAARRLILGPDYGSDQPVPGWRGTPALRAQANGLAWDVLLVTDDPYLDRYTLPMSAGLSAGELRRWRQRVQSAWEILVRHHRWAAEAIAAGVSVIVPLTPQSETDLISATSPAAFGAIATSWPPDPVTLAETLVHEFQHVKLCGLLDMVPLTESGGEKVYAPWRQDPRPAAGLLQGVYAHLGIVRFWQAQRQAETDPDDILRAHVQFARWRPTIGTAVNTLLRTGSLAPAGARFAGLLRDQGSLLADEPVPGLAEQIAREVALDHQLTWQIRHLATDQAAVARLAEAYRHGEPFPAQHRTAVWVQEDIRKLSSSVRSRLLNMSYLEPARYRELCADRVVPLSKPDRLLLDRAAEAAAAGYRDLITGSADPQPDAWVGLALALHQLPSSPLRHAFTVHLPALFDVHSCLGIGCDPLDLGGWFG